jgi:hypothetical protein
MRIGAARGIRTPDLRITKPFIATSRQSTPVRWNSPECARVRSPLGVVKEGAYGDLLLVDGNPLEDLKAVTNADNLRIIMKDGKIYKNTL